MSDKHKDLIATDKKSGGKAPRVTIIYYSSTGTVHDMAVEAAKAAEEEGAKVRLRPVAETAPAEAIKSNPQWTEHRKATRHLIEASHEDLLWADAIMLGSPTRFGLPASQLKSFIDSTGPLWAQGALVNKCATTFTSSATRHGGQESTILAINNVFYHWGMIIVPPGYADPIQFAAGNPYGASHTSQNATVPPTETELDAVGFQSRRLVQITRMLKRGDRS